jgi:ERCC4-type nuclease
MCTHKSCNSKTTVIILRNIQREAKTKREHNIMPAEEKGGL